MSYKCSKNSTVNNAVCCASSISRKLFHSIDYICGNFFGNKLIIDIIFTFLRWPWFFLMEGLLNQGHLEFLGHNFIGRARKVNAVICFSSFLNVHRSASFFETRRPKICTTFFSHFFLFFFHIPWEIHTIKLFILNSFRINPIFLGKNKWTHRHKSI